VVVKPFSQSFKKFWGSFAGVGRLLFRKQKSYPGLGELLTLLYGAVRTGAAPPMTRQTILNTVAICEQISARLHAAGAEVEAKARETLATANAALAPPDAARGLVFVTGGSGFLGKCTLKSLRDDGWRVRALVRGIPGARSQVPGIEYIQGDLGKGITPQHLEGVTVVAHLAAETAGNQAAHERNTIVATRNLIDTMKAAGVRKLINISSVAVIKPGPSLLREDSPIDRGNLGRGPYTWAKAEAEAAAIERAAAGDIEVRTVRLGPLVDFNEFTPPGRLGREVVRLFVAMGTRGNQLSVCDVRTAADVVRHYANDFDNSPPIVNLLEVPAVTRGALAEKLRAVRPDLKFMFMPFFVLKGLSWFAIGLQKLLKPGRPALDLYSAFKSERYDPTIAEKVIGAARSAKR
jgi:nucleoside-diphosphate-sugar epimerase